MSVILATTRVGISRGAGHGSVFMGYVRPKNIFISRNKFSSLH